MLVRARATIDLDAIASNWKALDQLSGTAETAAVIKADAYGHGAAKVGRKLLDTGCRSFFVATIAEGVDVRDALLPVLVGPARYRVSCLD